MTVFLHPPPPRQHLLHTISAPSETTIESKNDDGSLRIPRSARVDAQLDPALSLPVSDPSLPAATTTTTTIQSCPRRVRKACCICRRDKIRCDGARPCSACLKKGSDTPCVDGCAPCRRARELCDGRKPCRNCEERHLPCDEEVFASIQAFEPPLPSTLPPVKTGERAKLACLACRRDNKKCGDTRPCTRCISRLEECIHVNRGPKVVRSRCQACRNQNRKCEDVRPCRYCADLGEHCSDVPRKGRGHGNRVKAACVACRRNKTQCTNDRPCNSCAKRGLECADRVCACGEQATGSECHLCRTARGREGGLLPSAPVATQFQSPNIQPNFIESFGFPPSNVVPASYQSTSCSPINIDPLLMEHSP